MASGKFEQTSWDWQLQQLLQQAGEWLEGLFPRPDFPDSSLPTLPEWLLKGLFWLLLASMVAWVSWQLYKLLHPYFKSDWQIQKGERLVISAPPQSVSQWLQQARAAQQQGDYRTACRALYLATLQQLSDRSLIEQAASRTDGEYLSLLRVQNLPPPYQVLIRTHERLCFDRVAASAEIYDRCWQAYQEIERS